MNQESHTDSPERESKSGSPAYPAGLLGPDCGCPVYYAVTRCQHGEYACNLCNVEHTANCPKMQVAPVQTLGDPSDADGWLGPLPADMTGPAVSVEDVGLPSPDAHAVAEATARSDYHRRQALNAIRHCDQADLAELVDAIRELQGADAIRREHDVDRAASHDGATVSAEVAAVASELRDFADSGERYLARHGRWDVTPGYLRRIADRLTGADRAVDVAAVVAERFGPKGGER